MQTLLGRVVLPNQRVSFAQINSVKDRQQSDNTLGEHQKVWGNWHLNHNCGLARPGLARPGLARRIHVLGLPTDEANSQAQNIVSSLPATDVFHTLAHDRRLS